MDGNRKPGLQAPAKEKAARAGKPAGRLDLIPCLLTIFETFPAHTWLLADAQPFDDPFVSLGVAPFQILQ
jgi:hypothetical protein